MAQLIVDFPRKLRPMSESRPSKLMLSTPTPARRSVRFSETSVLTITDRATKEELQHCWYSKEERDGLRADLTRHLLQTRAKLATTPMSSIGQDDLYECIWMERLLSLEVYLHTREHRSIHVGAILAEQDCQRILGTHNKEQLALALLSEQSSEWSVVRACNIAAGYWDALKK